MDRQERIPSSAANAKTIAIKAGLADLQAKVWTALPAIVQSYDATKGTVQAQPAIQAQTRQPSGKWTDVNLPLCTDCPVIFPGGAGLSITFPLKKGAEGILIFASRCIDAWWQQGGVQKQAELRMHDLSDGFFIPSSGMSQPNLTQNVNGDNLQIRDSTGATLIELTPNKVINIKAVGGTINIEGDQAVNFTGPVTFNGPVAFLSTVSGAAGGGGTVNFGNATLQTTGNLQAGNVVTPVVTNLNTHYHLAPVGGNTGPPLG